MVADVMYQSTPFRVNPLDENSQDEGSFDDGYPATYLQPREGNSFSRMTSPYDNPAGFLVRELSLGKLDQLQTHLWFAGARRPAEALHQHVLVGHQIVVTERMNLHLVWSDIGKLFVKPLPVFLLDPQFWSTHLVCQDSCSCLPAANRFCETAQMSRCALGFLYSYACLIRYPSDFAIAGEKNLLPVGTAHGISWVRWKVFARDILRNHDRTEVHPRFHRGELRLGRLNTIHRLTQLPPFEPYVRTYRSYGGLFRENWTFLASLTVFIALVLAAMQVGLATDQLKDDTTFMAASYGFTIFAILGPIGAFGCVVMVAVYKLVIEMPKLLRDIFFSKRPKRAAGAGPSENLESEEVWAKRGLTQTVREDPPLP